MARCRGRFGDALEFGACAVVLSALWAAASAVEASALPVCSKAGLGALHLKADAPVQITSVGVESATDGAAQVPYCLVKVRVPQAIQIWVGLPLQGKWNGRLRSEGNSGYAGFIGAPTDSILGGYVGVRTDTGHVYAPEELKTKAGDFGMLSPGKPNVALQRDFAYRSQHLMATIGRQLTRAFYGRDPEYSYWTGCSEGGREGLRMAQDFPADYDGILAGAPAIYLERFAAFHVWPQVVMRELAGGPIIPAKQQLATRAAIAACDALDGVTDGIIADPRRCTYRASSDASITTAACSARAETCLLPGEAAAIDRIWGGATDAQGRALWPGIERGAPLAMLASSVPLISAINHPRYWVYFDPTWDWRSLTLDNYGTFFAKSVETAGPMLSSSKPDLSAFRARGGKILAWHGFSDPGIVPEGTIAYYESVRRQSGETHAEQQEYFRLFMAPGVQHCGGGEAPQPSTQQMFQAVVDWVERGRAPDRLVATQLLPDKRTRTRPLCPYPATALFKGRGSTDDAASFSCDIDPTPPASTMVLPEQPLALP